jgi:hypothetical protein
MTNVEQILGLLEDFEGIEGEPVEPPREHSNNRLVNWIANSKDKISELAKRYGPTISVVLSGISFLVPTAILILAKKYGVDETEILSKWAEFINKHHLVLFGIAGATVAAEATLIADFARFVQHDSPTKIGPTTPYASSTCPYCHRPVHPDATVCPFCRSDLGFHRKLSGMYNKRGSYDTVFDRFKKENMTPIEHTIDEIVRRSGNGYSVFSHKGKRLSKPASKAKAVKRLRQIEYFKHHKNEAEEKPLGFLKKNKKAIGTTVGAINGQHIGGWIGGRKGRVIGALGGGVLGYNFGKDSFNDDERNEDMYDDAQYDADVPKKKSHFGRNVALGLGAAALGGAYLHHRAFKPPASLGKVLGRHSDAVGQMRDARRMAKRHGFLQKAFGNPQFKKAEKMYNNAWSSIPSKRLRVPKPIGATGGKFAHYSGAHKAVGALGANMGQAARAGGNMVGKMFGMHPKGSGATNPLKMAWPKKAGSLASKIRRPNSISMQHPTMDTFRKNILRSRPNSFKYRWADKIHT